MSAMFRLGSEVVMAMTEEQFDREKRYQASMNMFRTMLKNGLITEEQYAIIDTKMLEKYRPSGSAITNLMATADAKHRT